MTNLAFNSIMMFLFLVQVEVSTAAKIRSINWDDGQMMALKRGNMAVPSAISSVDIYIDKQLADIQRTVGEQAQVCFFSDWTKNSGWGLDG